MEQRLDLEVAVIIRQKRVGRWVTQICVQADCDDLQSDLKITIWCFIILYPPIVDNCPRVEGVFV